MELCGRPNPDSDTGLEESMWHLGLGGGKDWPYPERPGEQDCAYFIRTGSCGYGERCRYNHPRDHVLAGAARNGALEYPVRVGQPVCQYFLKTGTCKFGPVCKYHHPRQGDGSMLPVSLNCYGYPLRLGEKECAYYVKNGQCKFGLTCKFHHPQPSGGSAPLHAPAFYEMVQPPSVPSPHQYPALASWQVGRPSMLPGSYGPMLFSPGVVPVPGWNPYLPPISPLVSHAGQQTVQAGLFYGLPNQLSPSVPSYPGPYPLVSSLPGPSSSIYKEYMLPERPGQPDCQYYMKMGVCKFGVACKYHHPTDWRIPKTNCILSPLGLPRRLGAQPCSYYAQHGVCKFGPTCKYDHPMGTLSYSPSASSLGDMPIAPYPIGFSVPTLALPSSSLERQPDFISNMDPLSSTQMPSSENTPSGSIGSLRPKGAFLSDSLIHPSAQTSTSSTSSSTMGHGSEIS